VAEAGVIRRDQVIAIGQPGEKWLKHSRRRRESVQQENRRSIFRAGLSIEDGESIYLNRAIKSRVFHGEVLSLGVGTRLKYCEHHSNQQRDAKDEGRLSRRLGEYGRKTPPCTFAEKLIQS
jgi:hypothetical protein